MTDTQEGDGRLAVLIQTSNYLKTTFLNWAIFLSLFCFIYVFSTHI